MVAVWTGINLLYKHYKQSTSMSKYWMLNIYQSESCVIGKLVAPHLTHEYTNDPCLRSQITSGMHMHSSMRVYYT